MQELFTSRNSTPPAAHPHEGKETAMMLAAQ
jgi:hypothetical protein